MHADKVAIVLNDLLSRDRDRLTNLILDDSDATSFIAKLNDAMIGPWKILVIFNNGDLSDIKRFDIVNREVDQHIVTDIRNVRMFGEGV